ncbi:MAG: C2H2-type zinc finger protein [Nitrososphaeraceae archaeon]
MKLSNFFKKNTKNEKADNQLKCKICNLVFQDKEHLLRHMKKAHGKDDDFMPTTNPFQV